MEVGGAESARRQAGVTASLRHPPLITYLSSARLVTSHSLTRISTTTLFLFYFPRTDNFKASLRFQNLFRRLSLFPS